MELSALQTAKNESTSVLAGAAHGTDPHTMADHMQSAAYELPRRNVVIPVITDALFDALAIFRPQLVGSLSCDELACHVHHSNICNQFSSVFQRMCSCEAPSWKARHVCSLPVCSVKWSDVPGK
eukprot:jgi/Ulvmu1/10752/UM068_0042.1